MQKKQLRTFAIIALVAIFVVTAIMRLNIEPADLGKGDSGLGNTQMAEQLATGENSDENSQNVGEESAETGDLDQNSDDTSVADDVTNDDVKDDVIAENGLIVKDNVKKEESGGGNATAVSDGTDADKHNQSKENGGDDSGNDGKNTTDSQPLNSADDKTADNGDNSGDSTTDSGDDSTEQNSGDKSGAWPPIPKNPVADVNNPQTYHCTVQIVCTTLLDTSKVENEAILPYIPEDGIILATSTIEFTEGENAFDVTLRACREHDIQFEFREDAMYSGAYVEGINYIYEMDAGGLSGWMYKVNGQFPNYGCKRYIVQDGDAIVWMYTCDLGRDVGDNSVW